MPPTVLYALMDSVARLRKRLADADLGAPIAALEQAHVRLCAAQQHGGSDGSSGSSSAADTLDELRPGLLQLSAAPFADARGCAVYHGWYGGAAVCVRQLQLGEADPGAVARFEKDAQTLRRMHHPYIVPFYGFALDAAARPFVVTAAYQCTLADAIHRAPDLALRPLALEDKFQIAQQIVCCCSIPSLHISLLHL